MTDSNEQVQEYTHLFRMLQLVHEMDSVEKVYRMLLAFATCGEVIGFKRAMLFEVDNNNKQIRGILGCEKGNIAPEKEADASSFEDFAHEIFISFEHIECSDMTMKSKAFSLSFEMHRSALVKAAKTHYPVLAEGRMSEFKSDPFFEFFKPESYVAVPIIAPHDRHEDESRDVAVVLTADNGIGGRAIDINRISLLFSLCQRGALAAKNLRDSAENKRRFRIIKKMMKLFAGGETGRKCDNDLRLAASMICRSMNSTGVLIKNYSSGRTLHIKKVHELSLSGEDHDVAVSECMEKLLDRVGGKVQLISGDHGYPLLCDDADVAGFIANPLVSNGDVVGAIAVYKDKNELNCGAVRFSSEDRIFLEISSGLVASSIGASWQQERLKKDESALEEFRSNLARERLKSRIGEKGIEYSRKIRNQSARMKKLLNQAVKDPSRLEQVDELIKDIENQTKCYLDEYSGEHASFCPIDFYEIVRRVSSAWRQKMRSRNIDVVSKIPENGPVLLMDIKKLNLALNNIMDCIGSSLVERDKALIECSSDEENVSIILADTGFGLPGDILSRLFMPFCRIEHGDERKNALSLAGEIIQMHGGEIMMKTSISWKTILILSFKISANKDRRKNRNERRRSQKDRRDSIKHNQRS